MYGGVSQAGSNLIARETYDPDRPLGRDVGGAALSSGLIGMALQGGNTFRSAISAALSKPSVVSSPRQLSAADPGSLEGQAQPDLSLGAGRFSPNTNDEWQTRPVGSSDIHPRGSDGGSTFAPTADYEATPDIGDSSERLDDLGSAVRSPRIGSASRNFTSRGLRRNPNADWRDVRDFWDRNDYPGILSVENRFRIDDRLSPVVDDWWVKFFPEDAGLKGEAIHMHHISGLDITLPLPQTRHVDLHRDDKPGETPGRSGSPMIFYPSSPDE